MVRNIFMAFAVLLIAAANLKADAAKISVAVTPFEVLGTGGHEWMGRAMQEGLATAIPHGVIVAGLPPADAAGALTMTRAAGADVVVFGTIQVVENQIRVSGQIISNRTGQPLGTLHDEGSERDLFRIEDSLAARIGRILSPPPPVNAGAAVRPAATLAVVGPTIAPGPSRYFDGNVMSQITPPARFGDDYDRYYYQTSDTSAVAACYGAPWGGWGIGIGCSGVRPVIATPTSGW